MSPLCYGVSLTYLWYLAYTVPCTRRFSGCLFHDDPMIIVKMVSRYIIKTAFILVLLTRLLFPTYEALCIIFNLLCLSIYLDRYITCSRQKQLVVRARLR